jgi:hypothetical protein
MVRLIMALALGALATAPATAPLTVRDIEGHRWTPLTPARGETNLVVFVSADCPISNRYAPEIGRIVREYASHGVHAWLVYTDPTVGTSGVKTNLAEFYADTPIPAIVDTGFVLTAAVGVIVTPEAAIYTSTGRVYRGRIDDQNPSLGQVRREPTRRDLRLSLDAVLTDRPVPHADVPAVGCFIERPR